MLTNIHTLMRTHHTHTLTHIHIHTLTRSNSHTLTYTHIHSHTCKFSQTHSHIYTHFPHAHIHSLIHTHNSHTYIHIHILTLIHSHIGSPGLGEELHEYLYISQRLELATCQVQIVSRKQSSKLAPFLHPHCLRKKELQERAPHCQEGAKLSPVLWEKAGSCLSMASWSWSRFGCTA